MIWLRGISHSLHFNWPLSFSVWLLTISRTAMLKFEVSIRFSLNFLFIIYKIILSRNHTFALVFWLTRELPWICSFLDVWCKVIVSLLVAIFAETSLKKMTVLTYAPRYHRICRSYHKGWKVLNAEFWFLFSLLLGSVMRIF